MAFSKSGFLHEPPSPAPAGNFQGERSPASMAQLSIRDKALEVLLAWLVVKQAVKNSGHPQWPNAPWPDDEEAMRCPGNMGE